MRRAGTVVAVVVPVALLAACGSQGDTQDDTQDDTAEVAGTDAADPGTVLALDDFAAVAALTLGVEPDVAYDVFGYESTPAILEAAGVPTEPYGPELSLENVAAARPDVIIGVSIPTTVSVQDQLETIAPTTVAQYTDTWQEQLRDVAEALGREERAEEVIDRVQAQSDELAADLAAAGLEGAVVSVVGDNQGFFSPPAGTGVGSVVAGVGLARPAAQETAVQADSPFVAISEETLPDHDGDHLFLLSGGPYVTDALTGSPLWPSLSAVSTGAVGEVSGELWLSPSAFATAWVLDDLRRTLVDGEVAKSADDAAAEFGAFTAASD